MPFALQHGHKDCPAGKPWAVVTQGTGKVHGCFSSRNAAIQQMRALYVNVPEARKGTKNMTDLLQRILNVSDAPWDASSSRFTDEQYKRACAVCRAGGGPPKETCSLPHHEPGGQVNASGVAKAAGRLNQTKGLSADEKARAKAHLRGHYSRDLKADPPASIAASGLFLPEGLTASGGISLVAAAPAKQYTLGIVYPAYHDETDVDTYGRAAVAQEVELSAWDYLLTSRRVGVMHESGTIGFGDVVESYIWRAPQPWKVGEQEVQLGDWLMGNLWDDEVWQWVANNELQGLSLEGTAIF